MNRTTKDTLYHKLKKHLVSLENLTEKEVTILQNDLGHDWRFRCGFEHCHRDLNGDVLPGSCECDYCRGK
jgi:hypothetical protein